MDLAQAQIMDGLLVQAGAVAFVAGEAVTGVAGILFTHERIPGGLGQHGGTRDAQRKLVAFDQGGLGQVEGREEQVIG